MVKSFNKNISRMENKIGTKYVKKQPVRKIIASDDDLTEIDHCDLEAANASAPVAAASDPLPLGNNRFVNISEFKGKYLINIREYYETNGKLNPGKKGNLIMVLVFVFKN